MGMHTGITLELRELHELSAGASLPTEERHRRIEKKINELIDAVNQLIGVNNRIYELRSNLPTRSNLPHKEGIPIEEERQSRLREFEEEPITIQALGDRIDKEVLKNMHNILDNAQGRDYIMQQIHGLLGRMKLAGCKIPKHHITMTGNGVYLLKVQVKE